jgi:hypothetical protein
VLVAIGQQGIAVRSLEKVLGSGSPDPDVCRRLFDQLDSIDGAERAVQALRGEIALFGLPVFDQVRRSKMTVGELRDPSNVDPGSWRAWGWKIAQVAMRPFLNLDEIAYLEYMERQLHAFQMAWPESWDASTELATKLNQLPFYHVLSKMIFPVFEVVIWRQERITAGLRAAQIALAAVAYEGERGTPPHSLSELEAAGWALPADPFGGGTYQYRREGDGFVVWSIGPDMDDDAGARDYEAWAKLPDDEQKEHDYDVIFRCER